MEDDVRTLQAMNDEFIRSVRESDAGWFDDNITHDFLNSNADGTLSTREEFLVAVARPCAVSNLQAGDVRIRIFGDFAIIHGKTKYSKADGQPGAGCYTDTYIRDGERWRCVAAHVTRL
jgi:ketosteroid isomerase-like protein